MVTLVTVLAVTESDLTVTPSIVSSDGRTLLTYSVVQTSSREDPVALDT